MFEIFHIAFDFTTILSGPPLWEFSFNLNETLHKYYPDM